MDSIMVQHPRFCSLMVRDRYGFEHWKKTQIDIDRHFVVVHGDETDCHDVDDSKVVNDYLAELAVSTPLSEDKPLWEIHVLPAQKCAVFRIHHALGDGISLMSMLLAGCRKADDAEALPTVGVAENRRESDGTRRNWRGVLGRFLKMILFSLVYVVEFVLRALWVCDRKTAISGGAGVELWPRKLATARFWLEDMKTVKKAVAGAVSKFGQLKLQINLTLLFYLFIL